MRRSHTVASLIAVSLTLNGCGSFPRPVIEPNVIGNGALAVPFTQSEMGSDAELDIEAGFVGEDVFLIKRMTETARLPDKQIRGLTLTESGLHDALRLMIKETGLSLNIEGGPRGSERFGPVSLYDINGSLTEVMDLLSETIGFFYTVNRNTLLIQQEQDFVIEIPPALNDDNAAGLTNTLQFLGAKDFYLDRINRSLVFKTNRKSLEKIEAYLKKVRDTRAMIIYDVNIFQVDLSDNADTGIQWNKLGYTASQVAKAATGTLSGLGMGIALSGSHFTIEMLINFLQTQGTVKALSRPRLAIISGTRGNLRIGQATTFVSKVGSNFSTSINQVTTETKDLRTGLDLSLFGDISDQTIYTRVGLSISEIVALNKFTALGTDLTLPQTSDRELNTVIRARPGDMILLGGITVDRDALTVNRGISVNGTVKEARRSELVLTLKTKVINFRGKAHMGELRLPEPPPVTKPTMQRRDNAVDNDAESFRRVLASRSDTQSLRPAMGEARFMRAMRTDDSHAMPAPDRARLVEPHGESDAGAHRYEEPKSEPLASYPPLKLKSSTFLSISKR